MELAVSFAATVLDRPVPQGRQHVAPGRNGSHLPRRTGLAGVAAGHDGAAGPGRAEAADRLAELLEQALGQIEPGTEIVLVSTRPVDLGDRRGLPRCGPIPRAALVRRIRCVDVSSDELSRYFRVE